MHETLISRNPDKVHDDWFNNPAFRANKTLRFYILDDAIDFSNKLFRSVRQVNRDAIEPSE